MKDKQSHLMLLIAAAVLLTLTTAGSLLHWRLVSTQVQELALIEHQTQTFQNAVDQSTIHAQLATLTTQSQTYELALPARNEVASVIEDLSEQLLDLGVSERSIVTGATTRTGQIHQIPVLVNFRGSFASVFDLLAHMHESTRLVRMERLVIQRDPASPADQLVITANLRSFGRVVENNHE